ncbi:MAG: bifunctional rhamnulose-1-phosphate aldolase/short-chain dehydrogenase [Alphaproteobacteria bacterium]|nr:bifunctional rhamnulose-1-phosphate aldolase/short-chain dehydrogenase [Alphaproteobacteria bacterium]MDE1987643.1 bifunctional rhamnulose-1-phosphate aldolase/short-chain dehydrogenase [Alphaproteobacteria bacterium]MDE2164633.1 bifunctional rhamnulose-1-phosphate aldolase/short-chain dehydrogenase [Alphaproteobacteria bacterium]MDE2266246.1 bifunctional rhamnulose-1-phosphate aldolase/short-chain dehydrogenase [Alphaproteobacteria bacterium]MDE2499440.1 bifunctional rhamnulose-1-phosphate 
MAHAIPFDIPQSRWSDKAAASLSPEQLLLYRSNLLGSDLTITNFGGGNTSGKIAAKDPLTGETARVLWVKGSGGDIGSMKLDGFATLYLDKLLQLEKLYRGVEHEDEMVGYLPHCTFNLNPRAASIDTPLHAFLPFADVDHVHPDAVIALAASSGGRSATEEIYGKEVGWLEWKRPGFELGLRLRDYVARHTGLRGIVLENHGLICWGDDSKSCYLNTIDLIARAARYLNEKMAGKNAFGGQTVVPLDADGRARVAAQLMPRLRAQMSEKQLKIGHFNDEPTTLEFVCSKDFAPLATLGTSCPDHFLRTKIAPLMLDPAKMHDDGYIVEAIENYRKAYAAYYSRIAGPTDPKMRDPNPVVVLLPGVGRFTFAADKTTARLAGEFYGNAVNVMRGATAIGKYVGLPEKEAFGIEYWQLEEAKLQRMPKPKPLVGRIVLVTGAAGGIGHAVAERMLRDGACVMLTDRDAEALEGARVSLTKKFGADAVRTTVCDVTDESQIAAAFDSVAREFGGLDIVVANAGLASSAAIEETSVDLWNRNYDVLAKGYFLTSRAAFPLLKKSGGSLIFIGSKNAIAATPNASAYASAKAAALHLARCLALEGAPFGIRVNVVNPDAVLRGSRIWDGNWRAERAKAYGVDSGAALEEHYRSRSLLKRDVLPEDIADAVYFFASDASSKSTGNIINVDAGNVQSFTR